MATHDISIRHEFSEPGWGCIHIAVTDPDMNGSQRRMVALARAFASRHYGATVGHYVSSGYSGGAWTYVFTDPTKERA